MSRTFVTRSSFSSLAVALLCSVPALAQGRAPTAADVESAKAAYTEGLELRDKGDDAGALAKFRAAYALVPTPITGLEVGRSLVATGHVIAGRALLLEVAHMPKTPDESEKAGEARHEAEDLAEKARAKLATLTVDTDPKAAVTIDDVVIPSDARATARVLDPGHHVIVVHEDGKSGRAELDLAPGEAQQIHVAADHDDRPPAPPRTVMRFRPGAPFWVSVIATGAGLAVGIGTGAAALAMTGNLAGECPSKTCPPSAYGDLDGARAMGWVSTIGFAVAGAGAIASVVTFALSGRRETVASVRVVPSLGFVSLEGSF